MDDVFRGNEARRQGRLRPHQLRTGFHAVYPDVYVAGCTPLSLRTRTIAAWLWSGRRGVVAGLAAAALHGSRWIDDDEPVELIWRNQHAPLGVITRNERLRGDEVTRVAGLPVTSRARTAYDLGRRLPRGEAVARLDALMRASPFLVEDVLRLAARYPGARGLKGLRAALPLVDPGAASPRETWLRLLLIDGGLPAPETQIPVNENWRTVGVLDMGWERYQVAVEYDGDHHRTDRRQYAKDQWRIRKLEALGWIVIRVIAEDRPEDVVRRAREALTRRGWRETQTVAVGFGVSPITFMCRGDSESAPVSPPASRALPRTGRAPGRP